MRWRVRNATTNNKKTVEFVAKAYAVKSGGFS